MTSRLEIHSTKRISRRSVIKGIAAVVLTMNGIGCASPGSSGSIAPTPTPLPLGTTLFIYRGHSDSVNTVAWSPDGKRIASGGNDRTVQVWNVADGHNVFTYRGHDVKSVPLYPLDVDVETVAWSPDGKRIVSGDFLTSVQLWNVGDGSLVYGKYGSGSSQVAWSPDGKRIAAASPDTTVQVWDAADGGNTYTYRGHTDVVWTVTWSPDSKYLASGAGTGDKTVQVWDATDGNKLYTFRGHLDDVLAVAWSPDGKRIASGGLDNKVKVWDAPDGGNVYTYRGHSDVVRAVAWSPDGKRIASGGGAIERDGKPHGNSVQVWDANNGGNVYTYHGHLDVVSAVVWSPDGKRIASGSSDKTVQIWQAV